MSLSGKTPNQENNGVLPLGYFFNLRNPLVEPAYFISFTLVAGLVQAEASDEGLSS